jgi:hypothetical protein
MFKAPLKKNLILFLIFVTCSGTVTESVNEVQTTSTSTTQINEKLISQDLEIGDCFEFIDSVDEYLNFDLKINILNCNDNHTNEVITKINYAATSETVFNDDQVPNLEIYDACVESYESKFNRPLAGTLTFIDWIGENDNFESESEYLCFVSIPNLTKGVDYLFTSNTPYQIYLDNFLATSKEMRFDELREGSCFNNRTPNVDLILNTLVDLRPCSYPHTDEVIAELEIPSSFVDADEIDIWALDSCYVLGAFYKTMEFVDDEERFEQFEIYVDYVFDNVKWQLGETSTIKCVVNIYPYQDYSLAWEIDYSVSDLAYNLIYGYSAQPEEGEERIVLYCPDEDELLNLGTYSELFIFIQNPNTPFQSLILTIDDLAGIHEVDLTPGLATNLIDEEQVIGLIYDLYYLYIFSFTGFDSIDTIDSGQVTSFINSISAKFIDSTGQEYKNSCYVEEE